MHAWLYRPLSGLRFLLYGCLFGALKVALDALVSRAYHHPFSLLFYVDPLDAPLVHPGDNLHYWLALAAVALPFTAVGVALCARRLHDAGMSGGYSMLFFVPFAHLLFFLAMVFVPSRPKPVDFQLPRDGAYRGAEGEVPPAPPPTRLHAMLLAPVFGAVIGLGPLFVSVSVLKEYGAALILGSPCIAGFATAAIYVRLKPGASFGGAMGATALALVLMGFIVAFIGFEGVFCILVLVPIYAMPAFMGAFIGYVTGPSLSRNRTGAAIATSMLSFFALLAVERISPLPALTPPPVTTEVEIDAPPEKVWPLLPDVAPLPPPTELTFRTSIAFPVEARMIGEGVGATRVCHFDTGDAVETVDVWEPGRALGFTIESQPPPLRELTLWNTFRQPHNDGYIKNSRGELRLDPLPGGRSRLTGISWYEVRLTPEAYWRFWIDHFVHQIHHRVMDNIKARAEGPAPSVVAAR